MTGAQVLLETLKYLGITEMFGYPGGAVLAIFDALLEDKEMNFILTRHEQGASHAADAYGRVSGKPGVCLATSGPGASNLVTGIMTAYMDSSPMIAITGQVPRSAKGKDVFQEVDIVGVTLPITKHNYSITSLEELPTVVKEAYHIATTGRPGPVLIDIPADIQMEQMDEETLQKLLEEELTPYSSLKTPKMDMGRIEKAMGLLKESKRPLILAGAGVVKGEATDELFEFATKNNIPVSTSLLGLGGFPGDNELFLGMGGIHGTLATNLIIQEADLVIGVGLRFDNRLTCDNDNFLQQAKIVHIDIDPSERQKILNVEVFIQGQAKDILGKFLEMSEGKNEQLWLSRVNELKDKYSPSNSVGENNLEPHRIFEILSEKTKDDTIICTDVGQHQMWTAQYYKFRQPKTLLTSGGAGTMGFGLPAAMGAKLAKPEKTVVSISGDGGFQMTMYDLATLKENNINVKVIIVNNSTLGMVKQLQDMNKDGRHFGVYLNSNPDFITLSKAYGIKGVRVTSEEELTKAYDENLDTDEPVIIECMIERSKNVHATICSI